MRGDLFSHRFEDRFPEYEGKVSVIENKSNHKTGNKHIQKWINNQKS